MLIIGKDMHVSGKGIYKNLYLLFNFAVTLKLFLKNSLLKINKEKKEGKKEGGKEEKESRNLVISPWAKSPYFRSKDDHSNRNKNNILTILTMGISSIYSELTVHQVLVTTFFMG